MSYLRYMRLFAHSALGVQYMLCCIILSLTFSEVRVTRSLVVCVWFFFIVVYPFALVFFFYLQILITPLISSKSSNGRFCYKLQGKRGNDWFM